MFYVLSFKFYRIVVIGVLTDIHPQET